MVRNSRITPYQTSVTSDSGTHPPTLRATIGVVDRPPPTHRSKPGPWSGWTTPMNDRSLISWATSWWGLPEIAS